MAAEGSRAAGLFLAQTGQDDRGAGVDLAHNGLPLAAPDRALRRGEAYALAAWVLDLAGRRYPDAARWASSVTY